MSSSRLLTGFAAAFFATGLSIDPDAHAVVQRQRAQVVATPEIAVPAAPGLDVTTAPPPRDLTVEVSPDPRGGHRVVVRRKGYLVSLRNEDARAAGQDWTVMRVEAQPGKGVTLGRLIWETTRPETLETSRGLVELGGSGNDLAATLGSAGTPAPAASWKSPRATCAGHHDGLGGFTVLCRLAKGAHHVGAANVTGARTLDDAWVIPGAQPLVRLDLPRAPGGAAGRVIGFSYGITGVALRVEASFVEGEAASLVMQESARAQPTL